METSSPISVRSLQYYVIARQWTSDLEFFRIETSFLHRLMDHQLLRSPTDSQRRSLIISGKSLLKLEREEQEAGTILADQLCQLELMAEDIIPEDTESLTSVQVKLEYAIAGLTRDYRKVKQELFELVSSIIQEKKAVV